MTRSGRRLNAHTSRVSWTASRSPSRITSSCPARPRPRARTRCATSSRPTCPARSRARSRDGSRAAARCSSPRPTWTSSGWAAPTRTRFGAAVNPWTRKYVTDETDETGETVSKNKRCVSPVGAAAGPRWRWRAASPWPPSAATPGGSARLPASYCGVVGFKPTYGRVSRWGLVPYCSSLDCPGFLTRTVADAVLMLDATQGRDALDPATLDADERVAALARDVEANVARRVEASKTEAHTKARTSEARTEDDTVSVVRDRGYLRSKPGFPLAGWRVGIPNEYFVAELSDETARAWTETADACERAGASVVPVSLPHTRGARRVLRHRARRAGLEPGEVRRRALRYRPQELSKKEDTYGLSKEDLSSTSPFASAAATSPRRAFGAERGDACSWARS